MRLPFFVYAGTLAVAGTIAVGYLSRAAPATGAAGDERPQRTTLPTALRDRAYRAAL